MKRRKNSLALLEAEIPSPLWTTGNVGLGMVDGGSGYGVGVGVVEVIVLLVMAF